MRRRVRPRHLLSYLRVTTASAETEWGERSLSLAVDSNPKLSDCSAINHPLPVFLSLLDYDSTNISGLAGGSGHGAGALRPPYRGFAPAGTAKHSATARHSDNRGDHQRRLLGKPPARGKLLSQDFVCLPSA